MNSSIINNNRTFGLEFELGYPSEANYISLILDNINALERFRDYEYDDDEELNAEDPSREARVKKEYNLVISRKHPKTDYYTDIVYFLFNFLQKYYYFRDFADPEHPDTYELMRVILDSRGFKGWDVHLDSSIKKLKLSMEIVTPPLMFSPDSIGQVTRFCNWMQKYAMVNDTTGLHCHVDAREFKEVPAKFTERLVLALFHYKSLEPVFDNLVMAQRRGNEAYFAQSGPEIERLLSIYKNAIVDKNAYADELITMFQDERYFKLNLHSLEKHGTLEFRQMHGTLNPILVKNWVTICVSFVNMILSTEHLFLDLFSKLNKELAANQQSSSTLPRERIDHMIESGEQFYTVGIPSVIAVAIRNAFYPSSPSGGDTVESKNASFVYNKIATAKPPQLGLSYVGFIEDKQLYRWYLDLTKIKSWMDQVSGQALPDTVFQALLQRVKNGIRRYYNDPENIYVEAADDLETPKLVAISMTENILNNRFGRFETIDRLSNRRAKDNQTINRVGQDFKQTQYDLAKNTPGINKSRAIAQARRQTERRPLAEDYLDEIELF